MLKDMVIAISDPFTSLQMDVVINISVFFFPREESIVKKNKRQSVHFKKKAELGITQVQFEGRASQD
jgi:hypothetical protein